jgi:hypothetical protein
MFCGGVVRWLVEYMGRRSVRGEEEKMVNILETEVSPGSLYASGLIAAGGIVGLLGIGIKLLETQGFMKKELLIMHWGMGVTTGKIVAVIMFLLLAGSAYYFARKPLDSESKR